MQPTTRRQLLARLALAAAGGCVAPAVVRIAPAGAHHQADHAGGPCPFGGGGGPGNAYGNGKGPP